MRNRILVEHVQSLSRSGYKNHEIARKLNLNSSSVSLWCRKYKDIRTTISTSTQQEVSRYNTFNSYPVHVNKLDKNLAMIILSTFYWCEGAKYPGSNRVDFVSSDEDMQKTFINLFRYVFRDELLETKFRVYLQLHETHNQEEMVKHWSDILKIPTSQFIKPNITAGKLTRYRSIYRGTCSLRYYNYKILLKIMGAYSRLSDQLGDSLV